eukprot:2918804-Rhodomonas_salina.1
MDVIREDGCHSRRWMSLDVSAFELCFLEVNRHVSLAPPPSHPLPRNAPQLGHSAPLELAPLPRRPCPPRRR